MRVRSGGFTLMELLMVISIFGIMLSIAMPGLSEMGARSRLVSVTNNISRVFKVARGEAVKLRQPAIIQLVDDEWRVMIDGEVITRFTNDYDDVLVTPLPTLNITPTGECNPAIINIADKHLATGDRCIRILGSGQSRISKEGC